MVLRRGSERQERHGQEMAHEDTADPTEGKQPYRGRTVFMVITSTITIAIIVIIDHTIHNTIQSVQRREVFGTESLAGLPF